MDEEQSDIVDSRTHDVADRVFISNKEHPLHLESGIVIKSEDNFTRVKLVSHNTDIHGTMLWIANHWLRRLPDELRQL